MPFPWRQCRTIDRGPRRFAEVGSEDSGDVPNAKRQKVCRSSGSSFVDLPWYEDIGLPCIPMKCITFQVPPLGSTAGSVLKHSLRVLDAIFRKHDPCIFKVGWTHSPAWRWSNSLYGYDKSRDGWTDMVILYISDEPYGPAMLEATLIDKHFGNSDLLLIFGIIVLDFSPIMVSNFIV